MLCVFLNVRIFFYDGMFIDGTQFRKKDSWTLCTFWIPAVPGGHQFGKYPCSPGLCAGYRVSDVFHAGVHTFSSRSFITDIPVAWRPSCELLVLDIGSNDIAQSKTVNKRAMELLAKFIYGWASLAPARCVIFIRVLPRTAGLRGSARQFKQNRLYYNAALTSLCKDSNHMTFAKVRGFEGRDPIAPVSSWSDDGTHPCSMEKYTRRLRFIVMRVYRYYTNN